MIKIEESEANLRELIDRVLAGEDIAVTRDGEVAVELVRPLKFDGKYFERVSVRPRRPFDGTALIRQMRDED